MNTSPEVPMLPDPALPTRVGNGSLHPSPGQLPAAASNGAPKALPSHKVRKRKWLLPTAIIAVVLLIAGGVAIFVIKRPQAARADVLTHKVQRENLRVTVTEKGTLESANNQDIVCKVRAGSKGFATSINWVIDDGSKVSKGERLMSLDDSALQDQLRAQKINVDTALSAKVAAETQYEINIKEGERAIAEQENTVLLAQIELEKFIGLTLDPASTCLAALIGVPFALTEGGDYKRQLDDLTGQVRLAEGDLEQARERSAWADRMVKQKYMSPAQAQAERSKLESAAEKFRGLQTQRTLLISFDRKKMLSNFRSILDNAQRKLAQIAFEANANRIKADFDRRTKTSIYDNETEKLKDIEDQIRECTIKAPQDGMVVYFKNESNRFGGTPQNLIEQGAQVKEGQKLLRLPNLDRMQVNTKVHEAMVSRLKADVRTSQHFFEQVDTSLLAIPDPFLRLVSQKEDVLKDVREHYLSKEYKTESRGQAATIKVDALSDQIFQGHVRSVAAVASQTDAMMSDVKVYQTIVVINGIVAGLKPDMTAEVTISIDAMKDVMTVPLQAIIGGAEMGATRKVFVKGPAGYDEKEVKLGLYNEKVVEVREGLNEGDEVVINPKVLLGDTKVKTRDADGSKGGESGKGEGGKGEEGGKKGGGDPSKKKRGGGPPGGMPPGGPQG